MNHKLKREQELRSDCLNLKKRQMLPKESGLRLNIEEGEKTKEMKMFPTIPTIRLLQLATKLSFGPLTNKV